MKILKNYFIKIKIFDAKHPSYVTQSDEENYAANKQPYFRSSFRIVGVIHLFICDRNNPFIYLHVWTHLIEAPCKAWKSRSPKK